MFKRMDRAQADEIVRRLSALKSDATPRWGTSTATQILGHLTDTVRYTMGDGLDLPFKGSWKTRNVYKPLLINQIVPIPHNVRIPSRDGQPRRDAFRDGTLDELKWALDEYLRGVDAGKWGERMHPFFGLLKPVQWRKFHCAHFEHHLTQFGV